MSTNLTDALLIARRYATAIFAQACAAKKEALVVDEIATLAAAIDANAELSRALASPLISRTQKAAVLDQMAQGAHAVTQKSLATVARGGRANILPVLARLLKEMLAEHLSELSAVVTSARPLAAATQKQLKESLAKATGKETRVEFAQNPELLGGLVVELGSLRLDASLSGALNHMSAALTAPAA